MSSQDALKIVFAGTPALARQVLEALLESKHDVIHVYTQPDRPKGRGRQLIPSPVKELALQANLPLSQPKSLRNEDAQAAFAALNADVMVVAAYGLILPQVILDAPRLGCINVHVSLLPHWRGAAPIQRAIAAGDSETGVSIMQMDAGLDTGPIYRQAICPITDEDTSGTLHIKLAQLGGRELVVLLDALVDGPVAAQAQDNRGATYADKIEKVEACLDWQQSAVQLDRLIRAFNPAPIAFFKMNEQAVRVWRATPLSQATDQAPGTVLQVSKEGLDVATIQGTLRITRLQLPNGKPLPISDILNGRADYFQVGMILV